MFFISIFNLNQSVIFVFWNLQIQSRIRVHYLTTAGLCLTFTLEPASCFAMLTSISSETPSPWSISDSDFPLPGLVTSSSSVDSPFCTIHNSFTLSRVTQNRSVPQILPTTHRLLSGSRGTKYCDDRWVCLLLSARVTQKPHGQTSNFCACCLWHWLDSSPDGVAICYVLLVSCLHILAV